MGGPQGGGEAAEAKGGFFRGPPGSSALLSSFASRPSSVWHPRGGSRSKRLDWGALHPRVCQGKGCAKGRTRCGAHGDIQESGIEAADQQARLGGQRPRQQGARGEVTAQRRDRSPGQRAGPWETRPGGRSARVLRRARGAEPAPRARSAAPPPPGEQGGPGRPRPSRMDVTAESPDWYLGWGPGPSLPRAERADRACPASSCARAGAGDSVSSRGTERGGVSVKGKDANRFSVSL